MIIVAVKTAMIIIMASTAIGIQNCVSYMYISLYPLSQRWEEVVPANIGVVCVTHGSTCENRGSHPSSSRHFRFPWVRQRQKAYDASLNTREMPGNFVFTQDNPDNLNCAGEPDTLEPHMVGLREYCVISTLIVIIFWNRKKGKENTKTFYWWKEVQSMW